MPAIFADPFETWIQSPDYEHRLDTLIFLEFEGTAQCLLYDHFTEDERQLLDLFSSCRKGDPEWEVVNDEVLSLVCFLTQMNLEDWGHRMRIALLERRSRIMVSSNLLPDIC